MRDSYTKEVNIKEVEPGMLVLYKNEIWTASDNYAGKLCLKRMMICVRTEDENITILTNGRDRAATN